MTNPPSSREAPTGEVEAVALEPCPFCGTIGELMEGHRNHWRVECPRCGVRRAQFANGGIEENRARAIRSWNKRASLPQEGDAAKLKVLEEVLNAIHEARIHNGVDSGYGWNITKLNRAMNAALPLLGKPVPESLDAETIAAVVRELRDNLSKPFDGGSDNHGS